MRAKELKYRRQYEENKRIRDLLKEYFDIDGTYHINDDGSVTVNGDCDLIKSIDRLPVKFSKVFGKVKFDDRKLVSLVGMPESVSDWVNCAANNLTSLVGTPDHIGTAFNCTRNPLVSLEGFPKALQGVFYCTWSENLPLLRTLLSKGTTNMRFNRSPFLIHLIKVLR